MKNNLYLLLFILVSACSKNPEIGTGMLDGPVIFDPSINNPENYLLSKKILNPSPEQLATPVVIACHGYSASTFEWQEMADWVTNENKNALTSQILLGGHGRNYESFKNSTWQIWQAPIIEEYNTLKSMGYTNISLAGSSTGGTLILELLSQNTFKANEINGVFLIDPIVIPSNKTLSLIQVAGPILGYIDTQQDTLSDQYWYHYRPQESIQQLEKLITKVRRSLQRGIDLPNSAKIRVYKSIQDQAADPMSAVLIEQGINQKSQMDIHMIESNLHVFTRLALRENITQNDVNHQLWTFSDMMKIMEE